MWKEPRDHYKILSNCDRPIRKGSRLVVQAHAFAVVKLIAGQRAKRKWKSAASAKKRAWYPTRNVFLRLPSGAYMYNTFYVHKIRRSFALWSTKSSTARQRSLPQRILYCCVVYRVREIGEGGTRLFAIHIVNFCRAAAYSVLVISRQAHLPTWLPRSRCVTWLVPGGHIGIGTISARRAASAAYRNTHGTLVRSPGGSFRFPNFPR